MSITSIVRDFTSVSCFTQSLFMMCFPLFRRDEEEVRPWDPLLGVPKVQMPAAPWFAPFLCLNSHTGGCIECAVVVGRVSAPLSTSWGWEAGEAVSGRAQAVASRLQCVSTSVSRWNCNEFSKDYQKFEIWNNFFDWILLLVWTSLSPPTPNTFCYIPNYLFYYSIIFNIHFMTSLHTNTFAPRPVFNPPLCLLIIALIKSNQLRLALDKVWPLQSKAARRLIILFHSQFEHDLSKYSWH